MKEIAFPKVLFITGTGTDVGKSYATGWLAKYIIDSGESCITQKFIQTGNIGRSEDIELHRKIMGSGMLEVDVEMITSPVIFSYPASPDLASRIDGKEIDFELIKKSTDKLKEKFDHVLVEGAGGIMVPLKDEYLTADYIRDNRLPAIVVISGELGSINHALLTLNAVKSYGIDLFAVVYNPFFDKDRIIVEDSRNYIKKWIKGHFKDALWIDMPSTF